MDDLTFEWKIRRLDIKNDRDEVSKVYWTIIGKKGHHSHSISGFTVLPEYDSSCGKSFIPYDQLDQTTIIEWLEEHIGPILNGYRSIINKNLDKDIKEVLIPKVPMWD